eukprot:scaffold1564_cov174-Amphora_coffeaeformis.AAC.7
MPDTSWATAEPTRPSVASGTSSRKSKKKLGGAVAGAESQAQMDEVADRTAIIANRLKDLYAKSVHPVEKRYQYDYFFESPFLTDVEFDGTCASVLLIHEFLVCLSVSCR